MIDYWVAAGADTSNPEHEANFRRTTPYVLQEQELMATLERLEFDSILEFGCGWGRITKLVHDRWPDVPYRAVDLSPERVWSAAKKTQDVEFTTATIADYSGEGADLVLAVEVLMHQPPDDVVPAARKLVDLAKRYVVTVDWTQDLGDVLIASWNFRHDYFDVFGDHVMTARKVGDQSISVVIP